MIWSMVQLKSFLQLAFDASTSHIVVMVIFIRSSNAMFYNLQTALRSFADNYSVHLEWGSYEGPNFWWVDPKVVVKDK
ncbi:hypothetical protein, partial [Bacillus sp. GbtcB14]|uniref:hypothetical protein n=1 Tax=Bacillus sp. GbtcB14 TaxID=2824759 RepID=UPI001C305D59